MRKFAIFAVIVIVILILYFTYQYIKTTIDLKKNTRPPADVKVVEEDKTTTYKTDDLNLDIILKANVNAPNEVKVLQSLLGFRGSDVDGLFGSKTQYALNEKLNVTAISLRQAFDRLNLSSVVTGGKDSYGSIITKGKAVQTRGAQKINFLEPKGGIQNPLKYSDFNVGRQIDVPDGFNMGYVIDLTPTEVLTKIPTIFGKGDTYYYALNSKVALV